jgi:diguanylate cyclase (GGDEF)-like protein
MPAEYIDQLNDLRTAYARDLQTRIREVGDALAEIFRDPSDAAAREAACRGLHNLVGSAGTFGFSGVSHAAQTLWAVIRSSTEGAPGDSLRLQANALLAVLQRAAGRPDRSMDAALSYDPEPAPVPPETENRLVYVIEDDSTQAGTIATQLRHYGYDVRTFGGFEEARAALTGTRPAAVIMDMILPEGDLAGARGLAALRRFREFPTPVLFLSVRDDMAARLEAVRAGADAYFTKPGDLAALVDRLDTLTARRIPEPYRVLIVDDEPAVAERHAAGLRAAGMIAAVVTDPLQLLPPLAEFTPDLVLLDLYMPACSGPEAAAVLRQRPELVGLPIVFLSAESQVEKQLAARTIGVEDFLTKPIPLDRLVAEVRLRAERARVLRSLMARDGQTGLLNHASFASALEVEIARARRRRSPLALAMIDIDRFKDINDTHGHAAGDRAIRSLARMLEKRLRRTDVIGRYGGDEFAVLLPESDAAAAVRVIDQVRAAFEQIRHTAAETTFQATFCAGVAGYPRFADPESLSSAADRALYEAKRAGRARTTSAE